jgi:hypothetical protein
LPFWNGCYVTIPGLGVFQYADMTLKIIKVVEKYASKLISTNIIGIQTLTIIFAGSAPVYYAINYKLIIYL